MQAVFKKMLASGDVYLGKYEGWYCVADETFWPQAKLIEGKCPTCGRAVEWLSEDDWFFRLSKYSERLKQHFREHPDWVRPRAVYNEMMQLLEEGLDDLSISRTNFSWGIPVPEGQGVIYVWFDALLNYISALGWPDGPNMRTFWPASVQLIGKEIARFHTLIWPAMLGHRRGSPESVFAHGWITVEGEKIGKSRGNAVDPFALAERFGADSTLFSSARSALRQRLLLLGRKDRAALQQRPGQRSGELTTAIALDAGAVSQRAGSAGR